MTVDRRWAWPKDRETYERMRSPAVFANVVNRTDREVNVVSARLGGHEHAHDGEDETFWLQPGENRELEFHVALSRGQEISPHVDVETRLCRDGGHRATISVPLSSKTIRTDGADSA